MSGAPSEVHARAARRARHSRGRAPGDARLGSNGDGRRLRAAVRWSKRASSSCSRSQRASPICRPSVIVDRDGSRLGARHADRASGLARRAARSCSSRRLRPDASTRSDEEEVERDSWTSRRSCSVARARTSSSRHERARRLPRSPRARREPVTGFLQRALALGGAALLAGVFALALSDRGSGRTASTPCNPPSARERAGSRSRAGVAGGDGRRRRRAAGCSIATRSGSSIRCCRAARSSSSPTGTRAR